MNTFVITSDRRTRVKDKIRRIADFVRLQDDLTHVYYVRDSDHQIVAQALPDADAALAMLREAVGRRQALIPSERERAHVCPTSRRLARLDSQLRTCIRALRKSGVEFVFCWQIAGEVSHLDFHASPSGHDLVREIILELEDASRPKGDSVGASTGELVTKW